MSRKKFSDNVEITNLNLIEASAKKWQRIAEAKRFPSTHRLAAWLGGVGAVLHPIFAFAPVKWPLLIMDGFLLAIVATAFWHETNIKYRRPRKMSNVV